ncbi:MAG: EAL domain-containing protein [Clostridia bacterium]|nr:EAL domain-containing protein [Clostridia bacterium]
MKRCIAVFLIILTLCINPVFAGVVTSSDGKGLENCVYVAGSPGDYPVEYYDDKSGEYCGIIPDLLEEISKRSGINFVYVNGDKTSKAAWGQNLQVDIVTVLSNDYIPFGKEYLELMSYEYDGETKKCGLVFTNITKEDDVAKIRAAAYEISADKKSGIYLNYASANTKTDYVPGVFALILSALFAGIIVMLILRIQYIRKENAADRMIDGETGMGNLQFFNYHFRHTINDRLRNLYYIAYIILDSSYLRSYHDDSSFDEMLKFTASVLSEYTGEKEFSARITENGFAVAYRANDDKDANKKLKEVMNKLNSFEKVKEKSNKLVFHAAIYHLAGVDKNCEILLFNLRKNCNRIFGTDKQIIVCDVHSMNRIQEEKKLQESILNGLKKNEFKMYLQFIVDNKTKEIVSAEVLSRWKTPGKGLIGPGQYIEKLERAGLISRHDFYMFDLVCRQLEKWKGTEFENISLSCNFTRITLSEDNFIDKLSAIANKYSFDKSKISIEITEDSIEKDREIATNNVMRCKELGFRVYLDDLGSGYTSLVNLCDYPIDVVKIDRDILLKTETGKGKELFFGIIALAHSLNIKVICEGVETDGQNELVSASDCDFIQGWYYSKPIPAEECESFIRQYKK